jgi:hypothetical protein
VRRSLEITSWEAAIKRVRELELHGQVMSVADCVDRFLDDRKSMKLSDAMMRKYRNVCEELKSELGTRSGERRPKDVLSLECRNLVEMTGPIHFDSRLGDSARSQTEIWLDRMPTSPTSRFFGQVNWICKNWPTFPYKTYSEPFRLKV